MAECLSRAIGRDDMIADPRFATNTERVKSAAACQAPIAAFNEARTLAENMAAFERAEVTAASLEEIVIQALAASGAKLAGRPASVDRSCLRHKVANMIDNLERGLIAPAEIVCRSPATRTDGDGR